MEDAKIPIVACRVERNENMNGLIRQFFLKKMRFDCITDRDIAITMHRLNHCPRKCLDVKTPHEVFLWSSYTRVKTPLHFSLESALQIAHLSHARHRGLIRAD